MSEVARQGKDVFLVRAGHTALAAEYDRRRLNYLWFDAQSLPEEPAWTLRTWSTLNGEAEDTRLEGHSDGTKPAEALYEALRLVS